MRGIPFIHLIVWLFISQSAAAEIFTVTNPAPAGAGTLRDAIEKANANGTREMDYIYFDIPARTRDKTIYINPIALLPALTSYITIDGTTQPGTALGVTGAKVVVSVEGAYSGAGPVYAFNITGCTNIFIYGLVIQAAVADRTTGLPPGQLYGIYAQASSTIVIGDVAKGNVINGWGRAFFNDYDGRFARSGSMTFKSNYVGIHTDGLSLQTPGRIAINTTNGEGIYIEETFGPVKIGGPTPEETNYFNSSLTDVFVEGEYNSNIDRGVSIINNRFGIGFRDANLDSRTAVGVRLTHMSTWMAGFPPIEITRNYFGGAQRGIAIQVDHMAPRFLINQNLIGYEENGQRPRNVNYGIGIYLNECENSMIGAASGAMDNTIRYQSQGAIILDATRNVSIFQNSTYCNRKRAIEIRNWFPFNDAARIQPFVTINRIDQLFGMISGKALPLSIIELFYDDDCPNCEGKTYFARTTADANGNWVYRGSFTGDNIIATATDRGGATSEYSTPQIDTSAMSKPAIICNSLPASICGLKIISGTRWQWEDASGNVLGTDTCLNNVKAGRYYLRMSIGTQSCEDVFAFNVADSVLGIDSSAGVSITHNRCGKTNGTIFGLVPKNASRWQWEDQNGNVISTDPDLRNVPAGRYRFRVFNRSCDTVTSLYEIIDVTPRLGITPPQVNPSTCNLPNGSVLGITVTGNQYSIFRWIDLNRQVVGTGRQLFNVPAGSYKLIVSDLQEGCADSTQYIVVNAIPAPMLDTQSVQINNSSCRQSNGSIRGIRAVNTTGTVSYTWYDAAGKLVGNAADLVNIPAGTYRLKMKDAGSSCDTVTSRAYVVGNTGEVTIDSFAVVIQPAGCTRNNGSITGLQITGGTQITWRNINTNAVVGNNPNLFNMPPGQYRLEAVYTPLGCTANSPVYTISTANMIPVSVQQVTEKEASCLVNNGSITISQLSANQNLFSFKWLRDSITPISTSLSITDLSPATYYLVATDTNGCEKMIYKKSIVMQGPPVLDETSARAIPDTCDFKVGQITGLSVTGGTGVLQYRWTSSQGLIAGNTLALNNLSPGTYQLQITDANACAITSQTYTITQEVSLLPTPQYDNQTIPRYTDARLKVRNPRNGLTYQLFDAATGLLIEENKTGNFLLVKVPEDRELLIKTTAGPCSSAETRVAIKVLDVTQLDIPNIFSPNGDGVNDLFHIKVTGYFRLDIMRIYNRWGQLVFETKDLGREWDGRQQGKPLPVGTYYWSLEGLDVYGQRVRKVGSITIIR